MSHAQKTSLAVKARCGLLFLVLFMAQGCSHKMVVNYLIESNPAGGLVLVDCVDVGNTPTEIRIVSPMPQKKNAKNASTQVDREVTTSITVNPLPEMKGRLISKTLVFRIADHPSGSKLVFDLREDNPFPINPAIFKLDSIRKIPSIQKVEKKSLVNP